MIKPLRVLIVEDSEDDTRLIIRHLEKGGFEPVFKRVETPDAMKVALDREPWDVVLSDYTMPHFNGSATLAILKESGLDTPFIMLIGSGSIGEDIAVEAMKAGAHDYLKKGNLKRLIPAIERELREAGARSERKKAEEALRRSEEKYRELYDNAPAGYIELDIEGCISNINRTHLKAMGYPVEEMIGQPVWKFVVEEEESRQTVPAQLTGVVPPSQGFERTFRRKDGATFPGWIQQRDLRDSHGRIVGMRSSIQDITYRKQAEEIIQIERDKLEMVTENIGAGLTVISKKYEIVWTNNIIKQLFGNVEGKLCYETYHNRSDSCPTCGIREIFDQKEGVAVREQKGEGAGRSMEWLQIIATPVKDKGGDIIAAWS